MTSFRRHLTALLIAVLLIGGCKTNEPASSGGAELIFGDDGLVDDAYYQIDSTRTLEDVKVDSLLNEAENKIKSLFNEEAITDLDQVIVLKPTSEDAYFFRALAKLDLNDYTGSLQDASKVIELNPDYMPAYLIRANSYTFFKDYEKAEADYNYLLKERPGDFVSVFRRGVMYLESGNYKAAINDFDTFINGNEHFNGMPECGECYQNRAQAHFKGGNLKQACLDWQAAAKLGDQQATEALSKHCK